MTDNCPQALQCNPEDLRRALSIHTKKITDSCRDKDCIEDLRVYLTRQSQNILDSAACAKVRCADLLAAYIDVEPVAFDRNHYCINVTFYYRILADATGSNQRPCPLQGLAVFSKRAVLCGEDSRTHSFTSDTRLGCPDGATIANNTRPTAVVEVLDPMVLDSKVKDVHHCRENTLVQIPEGIAALFDCELACSGEGRQLFVTLGQFSIIRLERDAQLIVPVLDYSIPTKECCDAPGCAEDPCEIFSRIPFPAASFTPTGCDRQTDCQPDHP